MRGGSERGKVKTGVEGVAGGAIIGDTDLLDRGRLIPGLASLRLLRRDRCTLNLLTLLILRKARAAGKTWD